MIIDGKKIAAAVEKELTQQIQEQGLQPCLAVVLVGQDPASAIYVNRKKKACARVGITSIEKTLPSSCTEQQLIDIIQELNQDPKVSGILVQLPLPEKINANTIISYIDPEKDVDGFHPENMGKLLAGRKDCLISCTPLGIFHMLKACSIPVEGKHVVIVGRSNIVGKPMAAILLQHWQGANATVTVVHSKTENFTEMCQQADILIAACGKPEMITEEMVKEGAWVIDVGINRVTDDTHPKGYRIVGDVAFEKVAPKCRGITPVPGGVGPMTIAMLLKNTVQAY